MNKKNKVLFYFKEDKRLAIKKINKSIEHWLKNKKKKIFFNYNSNKPTLHWKPSNIYTNYFDILLIWSNEKIKVLEKVKRIDVLDALYGIKKFYSKISTLKPDYTHPDILDCYNATAKKNNMKIKKKNLREKIEIDLIDPFNNVYGEVRKRIEHSLERHKDDALKEIQRSLEIFDDEFDFLDKPLVFKKNKINNIELNSDKSYKITLIWNQHAVKIINKTHKDNIKKCLLDFRRIIKSFNITRPNLNDPLTKKLYDLSIKPKKI